jgi:hypothetical protein
MQPDASDEVLEESRRRPIPRVVTIGGASRSELLALLRGSDIQLNPYAEALFADDRFTTLPREHRVEIAALSVGGLGFGEGATYRQIVARACKAGWVECPLELGPHLRLQYSDQPDGDDGLPLTHGRAPPGSITVASPPLDDDDETPKGFYLRRVGCVSWLRGFRSWAGHVWSPGDVLVFSRGTVE